MEMELNVFEYYCKCLVPITPSAAVNKLVELIMHGAETSDDITRLVTLDQEILHWMRLTVQRLGMDKRAQKADQMVLLLGVNRVRDLIIGRHIERALANESETLLSEALAQANKEKKKDTPAKEKGAAEISDETIPNINDFSRYLQFAQTAEEVAITIRNSYPGNAFASGVVFDYLSLFLKNKVDVGALKDPLLKKPVSYLEHIFKEGLRVGIASHEIGQKVSYPHQKNFFATGLLRNIGKCLLFAYNPQAFERAFQASTLCKDKKRRISSSEAEEREFDFDHAQAGALLMGRLPFFIEIERSVDLHHNPELLRLGAPLLYAPACILSVASRLVKVYQANRAQTPDIGELPDKALRRIPEFAALKIEPDDWAAIKANYALKLMKLSL